MNETFIPFVCFFKTFSWQDFLDVNEVVRMHSWNVSGLVGRRGTHLPAQLPQNPPPPQPPVVASSGTDHGAYILLKHV
jgi:hypothetical protein